MFLFCQSLNRRRFRVEPDGTSAVRPRQCLCLSRKSVCVYSHAMSHKLICLVLIDVEQVHLFLLHDYYLGTLRWLKVALLWPKRTLICVTCFRMVIAELL